MSNGARKSGRARGAIALSAVLFLAGCAHRGTTVEAPVQEQVQAPTGQAAVLIHKPAAEVFEAIVNPEITSKFWFEKGSGRLEPGSEVQWDFPGNVTAHVRVRAFEPNRRLVMDWWSDGARPTTVSWILEPRDENTTRLGVIHGGFAGDAASVAAQANDSTGGFSLVLAGLKAYLEQGVALNLVRDSLACPREPVVGQAPVGRACLLIQRPAAEVFEALVNPAITAKFWFVKGSGRLEPGKQVEWTFPGNVAANVAVRAFEKDRRVRLDWWTGSERPSSLEWVLTPSGDGATLLSVTHSGFEGDFASRADQANYSTGGFTFVLSWFKAYLEHDLRPTQAEYFERVKH